MKKTMTKLFLTGAFGLFASLAAMAAGGDIWSITRCDENGVDQTGAATTASDPFHAGVPLYFKIRLQARDPDSAALGSRWHITYSGLADQLVANALTPMQIGIYVSGRLDYATYVTDYQEGMACTAIIFKYLTKPGDFAMPIRLATATGPAGDQDSSTAYYFNPLRSFWDFGFEQIVDIGGGAMATNSVSCNWTFKTDNLLPESMAHTYDYSLEKCGFFVKTIDFSDDAEDPEFWRSVHEDSTITGGPSDPRLDADSGPEEETKLYVWSEDEGVIYIEGGTDTQVDPTDPSVTRKVGTIVFAGGQMSQKFQIRGVPGAQGHTTNIVLSAYNHYNYSLASGDRLTDYLTAKVKCIEPMPTTIRIERDDATVIAPTAGDDKHLAAVTRLTISATQAPKADVHVTINTVFQVDPTKTDWGAYVRFSTDNTVDTLPDPIAPVVTLTPTDYRKYIYVYALRAETACTIGTGKQIRFEPQVDPAEMAAAEITELKETAINVNANPPIITAPIGGDEPIYTVTAGEKLEIPVAVNDTYADMTDTATGYKVRIKASGSSTAITMPVNYTASGEGGLLESMDASKSSPSVTYPSTPGDVVTTVEVYSPIRKLWSVASTFKVTVTPAKTSAGEVTDESSEYIEGSTVHYKVSLSDAPSGNVYAFLYNYEESPAGTFGGAGAKAIITDLTTAAPASQGIQITSVGKEAKGSFMVLDGISADDGGSTYTFGVVLCTSRTFDPLNRVEGYPTTDLINITVYNKDPTFLQLYLNGFESDGDGYTFPNEYPKGQPQTIQPEFDDVSYDLDHGFIYKWTIKKDGKDVTNGIVRHDTASDAYDASSKTPPTIVPDGTRINTASFSYSFPNAGVYEVRIQMRDKDMSRWAAEDRKFFVTIIDQPQVQIEVEDMYLEMTPRDKIHVGLGYFPDSGETVIVKLTVTPPDPPGDNPGALTLDSVYKAVPAGYPALADNEYYVPFTAAGMQDILFETKDGTMLSSSKGFTIKGEVMNTTESIEPGVPWNEYYRPYSVKVYIDNETPIFAGVTLENTNAWKVAGGAATSYPIRFQIKKDVDEDFAGIPSYPGIKVTIMGCESGTIKPDLPSHPNPMEFYVTTDEEQAYTFTPNFGSLQGEQTITLMIEDKDGGSQTWTYLYMIEPSKFLTTIQNGPTGTGNSPLSQKYVLRTGRGQGHIFVPSAVFSDGARWRQNWNCSSATKVDVYGWGYQVGAFDNGWLNNGMDVAISPTGAGIEKAASADVTAGFYPYPNAERDSFLYAWIIASPQTEGGAPEWTLYIAPEKPLSEPEPATAYLPTDLTGDQKSYIPVDVEGVFALEWLPADNCGDINQDGVPDIFAMKSDWAGGNLIEIMGGDKTENDLIDLASTNPDEDLLPGIYLGAVPNSYAAIGIPFTTRLELRGLDDGLNATDVARSDISFSKIEQKAWEAFVEANNKALTDAGKDNTDPAWLDAANPDLSKWSPEPGSAKFPRLDPTTNDTDGDQFEDGWEYFFWYQAKVWVPGGEGKPLGKPRDGQHYVFERFNPLNIIVGIEIPADEVLARFNPCDPYDPENFDGAKWLKFDFDHDGLTDLEEQLIGTNPCHWDTDGDRLCDSWEVMMCLDPLGGSKNGNPDGDFMAFHTSLNDVCWIDPDTVDAGNVDAFGSVINPYAEGLRLYGTGDLQFGIDYNIDDLGRYVMLRTKTVVTYSFTPKFLNGENLVYGLREDVPVEIPPDWAWGFYMVDDVMCETITLNNGDVVYPGLEYVLIHDQVHDGFGFDPRTGWFNNGNGYVANRWDPDKNKDLSALDVTGAAVNTRAYENYDEYLVMKYRVDYGIDYSPMTDADGAINPNDDNIWAMLQAKTTNPNNVYPVTTEENGEVAEGEGGEAAATTNQTEAASIAQQFANASTAAGRPPVTGHGADTDGDGVPDGWELYMYRNPNAGPVEEDETGLGKPKANDFDGDTLSWALEYAGVDSCNAYKDCPSIYKNHTGNATGWWNKFFPTNPGTMKNNIDGGGVIMQQIFAPFGNPDGTDTDLDGIPDAIEGGTWWTVFANGGVKLQGGKVVACLGFVYGSPTDDGLTVCFRGGGMNPCTIDTDLDGIPDGWEMEHAGVPVQLPGKEVIKPRGKEADVEGIKLDDATFIADGIFVGGENITGVYIAGGMDATWKGDAVSDDYHDPDVNLSWDDLLKTKRDVDFDHDGLQNYQEYLTQSIRHFRYDDITTPLMGRQLEEGTYNPITKRIVTPHTQSFGDKSGGNDGSGTGYPVFDPADPATFAANAAEAWNGRSFVYYETVTTGVREVIKIVDAYTGQAETNRIYYTAQKKRFKPGAMLAAQHAAHGGTALQYAWNDDGWRDAGYFAPPRHDWDRAIASHADISPLYMYPITGSMVGFDSSVAGYATTDPRLADTDGDGMDDYYEMFHGLNPLLGTTPTTADETEWIGDKYGDIISAQFYIAAYPLADPRPTFNAWYNEWMYPRYSGLLGRAGNFPGDDAGHPIQPPQAYDPVLYPWGMGTPMVDADGDGIRNDEERIIANVADPVGRHTDPTPLWFTERTTPASFVAQYYVFSGALAGMPWTPYPEDLFEEATFKHETDATSDLYLAATYTYGFEENEGYDTDGDMTPDSTEVVSKVKPSSDPLRFDDPARRQALYLPGVNAYAISRDRQMRPLDAPDFLKQFTVECWFMPERTGVAQTIIERTVAYEGDSINTDNLAIRANFRIGLDAQGQVYGMFDNNDSIESGLNAPTSCQFVDGGLVPVGKWTHVALTFDGTALSIYINGLQRRRATTGLTPANGIVQIMQNPASTAQFTAYQYASVPCAFLIGARPKPKNLYALYPYYIEAGVHKESFNNLQEYFQGYVDEVRVWDGARSGDQILANYRKSMGFAEASDNRNDVFDIYSQKGTRNNNDGHLNLPPELVLNFDFSTLPGAVREENVAKTPAGFTKNVLYAAMSDYATNGDIDKTGLYPNLLDLKGAADGGVEGDLLIGWWNDSLVHSTVYDDYHVIPWIKNTVSHLPLMDGGMIDSVLFSDYFGGIYTPASEQDLAKFAIPNTAMPYPSTVRNIDMYFRLAAASRRAEQLGSVYSNALVECRFQLRNNFIGTADLVPLGGAFAKTCPSMWDGSVADPWEQTGDDTSGDGIPDWWEEYARHNYASDLAPSDPLNWDTLIDYNGTMISAGLAYVIDIYRGMQPDGTIDPAYASSVDTDGDNIPDWWENLFGISKAAADDDSDNDGLSNYAEYIVSFGPYPYGMTNGWAFISPVDAYSASKDQRVTDYFLRAPKTFDDEGRHVFEGEYYGEIFTDHDMMEAWWELQFANSYASPAIYDADKDTDGDGWDNWSENRGATWYGTLLSDMITKYLSDDVSLKNYPQPAIGIRFTYPDGNIQDISGKSVVVRTMTSGRPRTDATFTIVAPEANEIGTAAFTVGAFIDTETPVRGYLQPGHVIPTSCFVYGVHLSKDGVYFWGIPKTINRPNASWPGNIMYPATAGTYISNTTLTKSDGSNVECWYFSGTFGNYLTDARAYGRENVILDNPALDFEVIGKAVSRDDGRVGDVVISSAQTTSQSVFGSINFITGEFTLNPTALDSAGLEPGGMLVKIEYTYSISTEWPQTLWFNDPTIGRVKQGLNTIEAWMDLNGDGAYTPGEPYGVVRNVNVGWHRTAETVIELKDTSTIIPHYLLADGSSDREVVLGAAGGVTALGATGGGEEGEGGGEGGGLTTKIAVRRVGINGQRKIGVRTVPVRTLVSKSYVLDDRAYITEADVLSNDKFDLDWKWLVNDAEKLGVTVTDLNSAEYEISVVQPLSDGSVTNIALATFVNEFNKQRPVPVTRAPLASAPVYSAAPTFAWTCSDETMTAFRLQVSTSTNASDVVYDSGIAQLPGRIPLTVGVYGHSFTAPIYAGAPVATNGAPVFADGTNYFWRVAEYNAKFTSTDAKAWSSWTPFQMDIENGNRHPKLPTGYGRCGAVVRYFGPNTNDLTGVVIVEAHRSADFTDQPLAQVRADVSQLADMFDVETVNAAFAGVTPGEVFLMAYIDANNNGKRDTTESWGYANYIGSDRLSLYSPRGITVTDEVNLNANLPTAVIFIEDTDVNRNGIPDCLEVAGAAASSDEATGDSDRDGLLDTEEDGFGTDSSVWDTDGDGMPDGWEVKFAELDPNFEDAIEAADGDVMAFATNVCTIVTVQNTDGSDAVNYILKDGQGTPVRGDSIDGYTLYTIYDYPIATEDGIENCYGRGAEVVLDAPDGTTNRVVAITSGKVALVHAQVYQEFGFDSKTAVFVEDAVNTKQFTALDKYLVIRYLAALGICDEDDVNVNGKWAQYSLKPLNIDNDADGAPDGWELYVMFGSNEMNLDNFTNGTAISCWNFDDRASDGDADGLPLALEFDGAAPTDPWNAHTISSAFEDFDAWKYDLKTPAAQLSDVDNDGLSNVQEYKALAYGLDLAVDNMKTDGEMIDYFRTVDVGGVPHYIGELVADHDFMEDYLEDEHGFDRGLYDATKDADKDGWSNWAELRSYVSAGVEYVADIVSNRVIRTNISVEEYDVIRNNYEVIDDTIHFNASYDDAGNLVQSSVTGSIIYFDTQAVMRAQSLYSGTPYPTVRLTVAYDGEKDIDAGGIVVEAYSSAKMQKKLCWWNLTAEDFSSKFAHNGYITLELKTPDHGYLKEGTTHFAVFADMDSNGAYNGAEPFGIAKDVKVGYDRATDFTVELKDISSVVPRIDFVNYTCDRVTLKGSTTNTSNVVWGEMVAPAEGEGAVADEGQVVDEGENAAGGQQQAGFAIDAEEVRVRVIRTAINGDDAAKKRTLLNRVFTVANRSYLHEGDFFTSLKNDLDPYLASDAKAIGIAPANISEATYEVVLGDAKYKAGSTNANEGVIATFVNSYPKTRSTGTPLAPSANSRGVLTTAQATFDFTADTSAYTAYVLQVSDSDGFPASGTLASTNLLSGAVKGTVSATPAWYFENGKTYYWRVALLNGKYATLDKLSGADVVWSDPASFTVDLRGEATANVKYFGPAETDGKVVVEAYLSPDFVGDPIARVQGGSLVDGTNALAVAGLPSGKLYLLAFIDRNGDGVRQSYESWGYVCKVGTTDTDLWTPVSVTVNAETLGDPVVADIYIEDTDINQNFTVDPLDDEADLKAAEEVIASESSDDSSSDTSDRDGDGLRSYEEEEVGTDPDSVDTDGDGMWDGWEVWAGTDPLSAEDAAYAVDGDVMAYAEIKKTIVRTRSTQTGLEALYMLPEDMAAPTVGDNMNGLQMNLAYEYGRPDLFGIGVLSEVPTSAEYLFATIENTTDGTTADVLFDAGAAIDVGTNVTDFVAYEIAGMDGSLYLLGAATNLVVDTTIVEPTSSNVVTAVAVVDVSLGENRVTEVIPSAKVALIHNQVFQRFGFSPKTAVPVSDSVNTKPFTALDKYLLIRYFEAQGLCDEKTVNATGDWARWTLKPGVIDGDWGDADGRYGDGVADGWELYVGYNPWDFSDRELDDDGDGLPLAREYDKFDPSDPRNEHSVYDYMSANGLLLTGTPQFTDAEARRFGIDPADYDEDDDNDLLTNLQEIQAYYYDRAALADIDPKKAWSDGETPDYFRAAGGTYLGLLFNGGEFIEPNLRKVMGLSTLIGAGTRDYRDTGWDAWSTARYSLYNMDQTLNIDGVVSDELMLLIRYWDVIRPGEFTGTTVEAALEFFHGIWEGVLRLIDDEGNVVIEAKKPGGVEGNGTIHDADAVQTTTQAVAFFGGQAKMEEVIARNKKDIAADQIVTPEPTINLTLKYTGNESYNLVLEAWQVNPAYPELGNQMNAQWTTPVKFNAGLAKVNEIRTPGLGSLKQGPARFVAYLDADGDGRLSAGETVGTAEATIGYLGCDVTIRLGDGNGALPIITLADAEANANANGEGEGAAEEEGYPIQTLAIVRTKINGEHVTPRGVMLRRYDNNVNRTALYPSDFVGDDFIGIDKYLASGDGELDPDPDEELANVEEVTYEIVKLRRPLVYASDEGDKISNTNLNHYVYVEEITDEETGDTTNIFHTVDQQVNEEFTVRYSITRDIPLEVRGEASSTVSGTVLSFLVPADRAVTKFWLEIGDATYAGDSGLGFPLANVVTENVLTTTPGFGTYVSRRVILDADWFRANGIALAVGDNWASVALGNDKFPEMPTDPAEWSAPAVFSVGADAVYDAKIAVVVKHPFESDASFAGKLVVAAYEKEDFANPASVALWCNAGEPVEIGGLRVGREYYVAAWYVKDAGDGRVSEKTRMPYDSWGYYCILTPTNVLQVAGNMAFDPVAVKAADVASKTNVVYLQDTDWNDNGIADYTEIILSVPGVTEPASPNWDELDVDGDGIPNTVDPDPVFDDSKTAKENDVMAYYASKMLVVQIGTVDVETNWVSYVVRDPWSEPLAHKLGDETVVIPRGTAASELVSLYATYPYGRKKNAPLGVGLPVALDEGQVYSCEWKDVVLVHNQVYAEFGFNPKTANAYVPTEEWVNTKKFTALDKVLVTNYLAAVGALAPDTVWLDWVLNAKRVDFDYDGIPDGWELYTMFPKDGVQLLTKTASADVVNPWVFEDRALDPDGDELANLNEYDSGYLPTDPWQTDSDGDGIGDFLAWKYHLKGTDAVKDFDNDGLVNYVEYLLREVFSLGEVGAFDPYDAFSAADYVPDYFFKLGQLYVGDVFTDHDRVSDEWERKYMAKSAEVTPYLYDADLDPDGDGWSNYAEFQADTDPTEMAEFPVPTLELTITYLASQATGGKPIVVKAWRDQAMTTKPDAVWTIGGETDTAANANANANAANAGDENANTNVVTGTRVATYRLTKADVETSSSFGHVREGLNTFVAFFDIDANGEYSPGEPYGFVRDVDVGWNYAKTAIELTDTCAVAPRYNLTAGGNSSASTGGDDGAATSSAATDRETIWEASADDVYDYLVGNREESLGGAAPALHSVRVRVARIAVDGFDINAVSNALNTTYMATLYDRVLDLSATGRPVLTEADILSDPRNEFDIDWNAAAVTSQHTLLELMQYYTLTNVYYGVFIGNGMMESSNVTNGMMLAKVFSRKFMATRKNAIPKDLPQVVNATAPTFKWADPTDDATYTAFKIRIKSGSTTVWTSDYELMPPRDAEGYHTWTPPIRVGAKVPGGTAVFSNGTKYTWEIAIYNSKYQGDPATWAKSPSGGEFYMNALTASPDYATVNVAVRYYGPSAVVSKGYPVRVQAFATPDFSGEPVGEGYVSNTSSLSSTAEPTTANAKIVSLPQGTYYIRAFFDAENDGRLTTWPYSAGRWESWGFCCVRDADKGTIYTPKAVVVGPELGGSPVIPVYIDDCDTDQDTLPDIWEFATKGNLTSLSATSIDQVAAGFAMKKDLTGTVSAHGALTSGLAVNLKSARVAALMLDVDATGETNEELAEALAGAGDNETAEPKSVVITSVDFDRETGKVSVTADTEGRKAGTTAASQIYEFPEGDSTLTLTLKLWFNPSLDSGSWVEAGAKEITIERTSGTYVYDIGDTLDLSSGFFKVSLEK